MAIPEGLNGMNGKAWARAARERIGMTQHDAAVLANLTVDMVKKYESEKYRIQPSKRMRGMLEHYLAEHRRSRPSWNGTGERSGPRFRSRASPTCPTGSRPRRLRNGMPPPCARRPCCSRRRASLSTTPTCPKERNRRGKEGRSCSDSICSRYTWASPSSVRASSHCSSSRWRWDWSRIPSA